MSYKQQDGAGSPGVEKPDSFRHCTCGLRMGRGALAPVRGGRCARAREGPSGRGTHEGAVGGRHMGDQGQEGRTSVSALPDPSRYPGVFVAGVWGLIETRVISSSERWSQPTVKIRLYIFGTIGRNEPARPIPASILK